MPTLADQVRRRAHVYVAHGGKRNRRQQVDRLVILANWIQAHFRVTGLEQIGKRQVIAGIAELCTPESLVGKNVVLWCNLKPAKIGGQVSSGMILALGDDKLLGLATGDREVPPGTALR